MTLPAGNAAGRGATALVRGMEPSHGRGRGLGPSPNLSLGVPASRILGAPARVMQDRSQAGNPPFNHPSVLVEGQQAHMSCQGRRHLDPLTTSPTQSQVNRNQVSTCNCKFDLH
jgi:hypothetical protein